MYFIEHFKSMVFMRFQNFRPTDPFHFFEASWTSPQNLGESEQSKMTLCNIIFQAIKFY